MKSSVPWQGCCWHQSDYRHCLYFDSLLLFFSHDVRVQPLTPHPPHLHLSALLPPGHGLWYSVSTLFAQQPALWLTGEAPKRQLRPHHHQAGAKIQVHVVKNQKKGRWEEIQGKWIPPTPSHYIGLTAVCLFFPRPAGGGEPVFFINEFMEFYILTCYSCTTPCWYLCCIFYDII